MGIYAVKFGAACDGRGCDATVPPSYASEESLSMTLFRLGWVTSGWSKGRYNWLCPACAAKKSEAAR